MNVRTEKEIKDLVRLIRRQIRSGQYRLSEGEFKVRLDTLNWVLNKSTKEVK